MWMGRGWVERKVVALDDPAAGHTAFGPIDHSARVGYDGHVGWGIFEHFSIGRHRPSGMADLGSVAP